MELRFFKLFTKSLCLIIGLYLMLSSAVFAEDVPVQEREKAYTLESVDTPGENTITKFELDPDTNTLVPKYYKVVLSKTEYGTGSQSEAWGFEKDANGNKTFVKNPVNPTSTITVKYDNSYPQSRINNTTDKSSTTISGNFLEQIDINPGANAYGGPVYNRGKLGDINADFMGNYAFSATHTVKGGAIYNKAEIGKITGDFIGNYVTASSESGTAIAQGGAIYTNSDLNIIADNGTSLFSGNKTITTTNKGTENETTVEDQNAIYVDSDMAALKLESKNNEVIQFDDKIDG